MSKSRESRTGFAVLAFALTATLGAAGSAQASDWTWTITPYIWGSDVKIDATINDRRTFDTEAKFGDIVSKLDMVLQLHLEGQKGKHGVLFDVTYLDLGNDSVKRDLPGILPGTVELKVDTSMTLLELGGTYNPSGDGSGVGILYGARILDANLELDADFSSALFPDRGYQASKTLIDAMVGVRYMGQFAERWSFRLRGDISAGGTDFTWNALAGFGYSFGETGRYTALAGYRYMALDFKDDDKGAEVKNEGVFSGAFVALAIKL